MNKVTNIVTFLLCAIAACSLYYLSTSSSLELNDSQLVNSYITITASLGALVSATFVVFSYLQTNNAYIEAQRPHLLIQIESLKLEGLMTPVSIVHYQNITNNRFNDLTVHLKVSACNREYSLSELFRQNMTMIGQDHRQRTFDPVEELNKLGLDLQSTAEAGSEVSLSVNYEYTFNKKLDQVNAQKYQWNAISKEWAIV